jgi:TonB family protein
MAGIVWFFTHPDIFSPSQSLPADKTIQVTVELWEEPPVVIPDAPLFDEVTSPEEIPVPVPVPEPDPAPIEERVPDPVSARKPPPPKQKPSLRAQTAPKPVATGSSEAVDMPTPPRTDSDASRRFISDFLKLVEKSKYYPGQARRDGITGIVKVRVSFSSAGDITGMSLLPGSYDPVLGEAAMTTIDRARSRWKAKAGGPGSLVVPIAFRIK